MPTRDYKVGKSTTLSWRDKRRTLLEPRDPDHLVRPKTTLNVSSGRWSLIEDGTNARGFTQKRNKSTLSLPPAFRSLLIKPARRQLTLEHPQHKLQESVSGDTEEIRVKMAQRTNRTRTSKLAKTINNLCQQLLYSHMMEQITCTHEILYIE